MANRSFTQFSYSLEKAQVTIFLDATIGAAGAPTLVTANSKGVSSITRNSAGNYTVVLQDAYTRLLGIDALFLKSTGIPAAPNVGLISAANSGGVMTINFVCSTGGTATDPSSGEEMFFALCLSNSTAT